MSEDAPNTYSISLRVRCTTTEYAFMSVPVNSSVMRTGASGNPVLDEKGFAHIDPEKRANRGVELGSAGTFRAFRRISKTSRFSERPNLPIFRPAAAPRSSSDGKQLQWKFEPFEPMTRCS